MKRVGSLGSFCRVVALAVFAAPSAPAQQLWVVADGAPLQPVIDAASPGDRIQIFGVGHGEAVLTKPLDVFGGGDQPVCGRLRVRDLGCGTTLRLADLITNGIEISDCHGTILIERVLGGSWFLLSALDVTDSTGVLLRDSRFIGSGFGVSAAAMRAWRSDIVALDTRFEGAVGTPTSPAPVSGSGISLFASTALLVRCRVVGGPAQSYYDHSCPCQRVLGPTLAVFGQQDAHLTMVGDGFLGVRGDASSAGYLAAFGRMTLTLDPGVTVFGRLDVTVRAITTQASLSAPGTMAPGSSANATVTSDPGDLVALMVDLASPGAIRFPALALDVYITGNAKVLRWTTSDSAGLATLSLVVPPDPALRGRMFWLQAFAFGALGQRAASPPALLHLR